MIDIDASELGRLEAHLGRAAKVTAAGAVAVGKKAAQNVKEGLAADAAGHPHFSRLPSLMGYDTYPLLLGIGFRIGPASTGQGNLANIFYFGTATQGPTEDITRPLAEESPRLEKALAELAERALG